MARKPKLHVKIRFSFLTSRPEKMLRRVKQSRKQKSGRKRSAEESEKSSPVFYTYIKLEVLIVKSQLAYAVDEPGLGQS